MTVFLKEVETTEVARDSLKIDVNKPASRSAQDLSGVRWLTTARIVLSTHWFLI